MVLVEISFPRGGTVPQSSERQENIVFGARLEKKKSDKKRLVKTVEDDDVSKTIKTSEDIKAISAELLNYKTVQEGMIIMGTIKSIDAICLKISLPGCMIGKVLASSISESYNKILKEFVKSADRIQHFKPLNEMYEIGQKVYVKVIEIKENENGNKLDLILSLKPNDVHSNLYHEKMKKGMLFNGAIEEIQDHGYIIESGIKNLRCFLPIDQNNTKEYGVGELVFLKIEKLTQTTNASIAICKSFADENKRKIKDLIEPNLDYLLPTTLIKFTITKILKDGLQGSIMNDLFTGYINEHQLSQPFALPDDYNVNSTILARILYVMPLTKLMYLSLNLNNYDDDENIRKFQRGDIIENAVVHHHGTGGIILVLNNTEKGIISFKSIKTNFLTNYDQDEIISKYHKKSKHKIRILDYDPMDSLYICSDNKKILNENYFSLNDCKIGEFVSVTINKRDKNSGSLYVQLGNCHGLIERIFLSTTFNVQDNQKIRCRIMAVNTERNIVYLTNRSEYMTKNCKILTNIKQAKENRTFFGTIVKCTERFFIVKFFNNIKGILYKQKITGFLSNELNSFNEGQTMSFRIVKREGDKLLLDMIENTYKIGEFCDAKISNCLQTGLEIEIENNSEEQQIIKGLIPIRLITEFPDLYAVKLKTFKSGDSMKIVNINKTIFSLRDVEYFKKSPIKNFKSLEYGDILRAFIKNVEGDIIEILLPIRGYDKLLRLHSKMLLINLVENANITVYPEQIIYVKVLSKEIRTKSITVTGKLTDVWNGDFKLTGNFFGKYLNELSTIKEHLKKFKNPLGQIQIGEHLTGTMAAKIEDTEDWYVQLSNGLQGIVKKSIIGKDKTIAEGQAVNLVVLWIDYQNEFVYCSHKQNDIDKIEMGNQIPKNLIDKSGINCKVLLNLGNVIICSLKKGKNPIIYVPTKLHYNDFSSNIANEVKDGDFGRLTFIHESYPIAVFENTFKLWTTIKSTKRKFETEAEEIDIKRKKLLEKPIIMLQQTNERILDDVNSDDNSDDSENIEKDIEVFFKDTEIDSKKSAVKRTLKEENKKINSKKQMKEIILKSEIVPVKSTGKLKKLEKSKKSDENISKNIMNDLPTVKPQTEANISKKINSLPGASGFWSTNLESIKLNEIQESSSEEDETIDENLSTKKKKKLTTSEKFKIEKAEEARLREIEEKYANPNIQPETVDQFERLVLSDPNNSKNWINYMVFHLQATEIDKAKTIARKALKSISFRDQDELLNIWIALLNLELTYGTKETFTDTFKEAQLCNDPLKMYTRVLEILSDAKKTQELIDLIGTITKKFRDNSEIWKKCANAYFKLGLIDKAKQLMHKALAVLPERDHVNTIVGFANLHHNYGDSEIAHTLLEQIISSYPKRVDVWSQYIDMLVKDQQIEAARRTLERAVIQKIPIKKMRTLFKKYLEFEERHGNEENVQKVKELAANYVKNEITS